VIRFYTNIFIGTVCILVAQVAFAVSDTVTVSQVIGIDTTPPTIPVPVTVTPIASTQIDVAWGVSTDDQNLTGYRLFRDAVQIATTSLTTYSDTGLLASTTYTYTVEAYDWSFNISTSSAPVSTTTFPAPVIAPAPTSSAVASASTRVGSVLKTVQIETDKNSASISWETNMFIQYSLRWGRVSVYDLGFVRNDTFKKEHTTLIDDLEPGTTYVYELRAYTQSGTSYVLKKDSFTTESSPDTNAPSNVADLTATKEGDSVKLSWDNPSDTDFSKVRIVRNYNFYPLDPSNGFIAYEGTAESYFDAGVLSTYTAQYYTIFSYDETGNISSGAVIKVDKNDANIPETARENVDYQDSEQSTPGQNNTEHLDVDFSDVLVLQNNVRIDPVNEIVSIVTGLPVVIQIPYELLPEHLKTIVVTIQGTDDEPVSYMLRVNKDKSAFEAMIPSFAYSGEYSIAFSVYDYKTEILSVFDGTLLVKGMSALTQFTQQTAEIQLSVRTILIAVLFVFLLSSYALYFFVMRKRSGEDKHLGA